MAYGTYLPADQTRKRTVCGLSGTCHKMIETTYPEKRHRYRTRRVGRPPNAASKHNGYLEQQIIAAEEAVRQLKEAQAQLEEDNAQQQPRLDIYEVGMKAADAHLSFLLISRCAFSRQTRAVLALEDANLVSKLCSLSPAEDWQRFIH